jgi:hypothetical protein
MTQKPPPFPEDRRPDAQPDDATRLRRVDRFYDWVYARGLARLAAKAPPSPAPGDDERQERAA